MEMISLPGKNKFLRRSELANIKERWVMKNGEKKSQAATNGVFSLEEDF
jgi:hypothetical protein